MEKRVRRPNYCAGAIAYDSALRERRIKCQNETGDPLVRLCAGCRVIEKLEEKRRRKLMFGTEDVPTSRRIYRQHIEEESSEDVNVPSFPTRRNGSDR